MFGALHSSTSALLALHTAENAPHHEDDHCQDKKQNAQDAHHNDTSEVVKELQGGGRRGWCRRLCHSTLRIQERVDHWLAGPIHYQDLATDEKLRAGRGPLPNGRLY